MNNNDMRLMLLIVIVTVDTYNLIVSPPITR